MQSDIEIANAATLRPIREVAEETLGIDEQHLVPYGHYKAKVDLTYLASLADRPLGRLVLVTALSPTPPGEGKTTTTVAVRIWPPGVCWSARHHGCSPGVAARQELLSARGRPRTKMRAQMCRFDRAHLGNKPYAQYTSDHWT